MLFSIKSHIISPFYKQDGAPKWGPEVYNSDLYYYYFKEEDLGKFTVGLISDNDELIKKICDYTGWDPDKLKKILKGMSVEPTDPTEPTVPTDPEVPTEPTKPTDPTNEDPPNEPTSTTTAKKKNTTKKKKTTTKKTTTTKKKTTTLTTR